METRKGLRTFKWTKSCFLFLGVACNGIILSVSVISCQVSWLHVPKRLEKEFPLFLNRFFGKWNT